MVDDLAAELGLPAMLAPLPGDSPVGADLRQDLSPGALFPRLRDARSEARDAERQADAGDADAPVPPAWRTIGEETAAALTLRSKDLQLAAWLTEALLRGHGVAGLAVGARLMTGLVRAFWSAGLYPVADEDGVATRVMPVAGLNGESSDGTLVQPLRKQTMFRRTDGTPVAFWQFDAARSLQAEPDAKKRAQRLAAGVLPFDELERDAAAAGPAKFGALRGELRDALAAWSELDAALAAAAGADAPSTSRIAALLTEMLASASRYAPPEVGAGAGEAGAPAQDAPAAARPAAASNVETREGMLSDLSRIADFFRRTEPHSPLAYTLDEAVRRARMSWPDLIAEIVPDANQRNNLLMQLGIKPVK